MRQSTIGRNHTRAWARRSVQLLTMPVIAVLLAGCPLLDLFPTPPPPPDPDPGPTFAAAPASGLEILIDSIFIPLDRRVEVTFRALDDRGNIVPRKELTDVRFVLSRLEPAPRGGDAVRYISYTSRIERDNPSGREATQATFDSAALAGVTQNANGSFTYQFDMQLPSDFDRRQQHRVAGQFRRMHQTTGVAYPANAVKDFRPDGASVQAAREIVNTETCNTCHTRLALHGNIRRDVGLCVQCHNPGSGDAQSGNTVDFAEMIHKIHRGEDLPSVRQGDPYFIGGFGGSIHDFSTVAFPQDIRNCQVCHTDAPHADVYLTQPTMAGCASCHDRTWFGNRDEIPDGYTMHVGGQQVNDNLCSQCHTPTAPGPAPIFEAHLRPRESNAAPGLAFDIIGVDVLPEAGTGGRLRITFDVLDKHGQLYPSLSQLNAAGATFAYPAPEFEAAVRETIVGGGGPSGTLTANADGSFSYLFAAPLPELPGETFAVAMDGRVTFSFRGQNFNQGTSTNAYTVFTADGSTPVARRSIISDENCSACHGEIRAHGESRTGVQLCVMCHNVNATDRARRTAETLPPETINFKDLIHRIHRGEDLASDYTVYGFGNTPHDFTHTRFPGRLESCTICHVNTNSTQLPLSPRALSTMVTMNGELVREVLPERAACTSCHDHFITNVHALVNTEGGVETCATCHGPGSTFAVNAMHLLEP